MIAKKLLEFQKANITIQKDGANPHFKSSYATLNEVLDKVKGPLNDMGILIIQKPCEDGLRTILRDTEDNTEVECFMPYVEATTAQKLGSCNTYLRRYSLVTLLCLEDEDDDGNAASVPEPAKAAPVPKSAPSPLKAADLKQEQKKEIKKLCDEMAMVPLLSKADYEKYVLDNTGLKLGEDDNGEIIKRLKALK